MKISDDYKAKLRMWAQEGKVYPIPQIANLPHFGHRTFSSYEEMNAWKEELMRELARQGGARWIQSSDC